MEPFLQERGSRRRLASGGAPRRRCRGDDGHGPPPGQGPPVPRERLATGAGGLAAAARCLILPLLLGAAPAAAADLFVAAASGAYGSGALLADGASVATTFLLPLQSQVRLRFEADRLYVIQGPRAEVMFIIPGAWRAPVAQVPVGDGTDPRDVAVVAADEVYVSRRAAGDLIRIDVFSGAVLARVDLTPLADADGVPEMTRLARLDDRLYVLCQRLDRTGGERPAGNGRLAVVDPASDRLVDSDPSRPGVQGIDVGLLGPVDLAVVGNRLVVAGPGGVVAVDPATGAVQRLRAASAYRGALRRLALTSNRAGYAVLRADSTDHVVPVSLVAGTVGAPLAGLTGGPVPDLVVDGDRLFVADRGRTRFDPRAGLYVFDAHTGRLVHGPIDVGQKPLRMLPVTEARVTAVGRLDPAADGPDRLLPAFPNPFNDATVIPVVLARASAVRLTVHDLLGRRVRRLYRGRLPAGRHDYRWEGRDDAGRPVATGLYLSRLRTEEGTAVGRLLMVR